MDSENGLTKPANIKSGVPQGSILGLKLFLLFINDLHLYIEQCASDYYADDATILKNRKTKSYVEAKLQHGGNKTKEWGKQNKMNMHYEKNILYVTRNETQHSEFSRIGHLY